jgi:secondary thiamine-phosphate synthase enzyme
MTELDFLVFNTMGKNEIVNITEKIVKKSSVDSGNVLIFVPGATGALSTIEFEPGLIKDLPEIMEKLIPQKRIYHHNETWHDGNGHSHIRATLLGPSLTIPFSGKKMILGTWQQIIFLEFDNKPHKRRLAVQITG